MRSLMSPWPGSGYSSSTTASGTLMSTPPIASTTRITPLRSTMSTASIGRPVSVCTTERTAPMPFTGPRPGHSPGLRAVASTYISLSSPGWQPHTDASRAAPGGYGAYWRLRGRPIIAVSPVLTSTSTSSITSLRRLQRPPPASDPMSRRSNRPSSPHGIAPGRSHGTDAPKFGNVPLPPSVGKGGITGVGAGDGPRDADGAGLPPDGAGAASDGGSVASGGSVGSGIGVSASTPSGRSTSPMPAKLP